MESKTAIIIALASGLFALLGALGSQAISAYASLRQKRIELVFQSKADAYMDFMRKAGTFAHDSSNEAKYVEYLHTYLTIRVIASDQVLETLESSNGVKNSTQRLRIAETYSEKSSIQVGPWYNAMEAATKAMREGLQRLSRRQ